jgi:phosphoglycolate phosphatase
LLSAMPESTSNLPQAFFFDLDGTLFDSFPGIAFSIKEAFTACGLPMQPNDLREIIGPPIRTILTQVASHATDSDLDLLERAFRNSYDSDGWQKTLLFPGAHVMLHEAHSLGIQLFVVSNKPRHISVKILERERILDLFNAILTRDSNDPPYTGKEQMIEHLLQSFQLDASRCIMVGDTAEDAHSAAAMQVLFAWMAHGYGKLPSNQAVALRIHSFQEFLSKVAKEFVR